MIDEPVQPRSDESENDRDHRERERVRSEGMSQFMLRFGLLRYGLPLLAVSLIVLAVEGRLTEIDAELFVVRIAGPVVAGLVVARMGWAKIVRRRLDELEERQS